MVLILKMLLHLLLEIWGWWGEMKQNNNSFQGYPKVVFQKWLLISSLQTERTILRCCSKCCALCWVATVGCVFSTKRPCEFHDNTLLYISITFPCQFHDISLLYISIKFPCQFHDISFYTLSAIRVFWSFQSLILTHNILIALVNDNSAYFHWFHRVSWTPWKLLWTPKKLPVEFPHKFLILTLFLWLHENSFFPPWSFHGALVWSCEFFNFKGRI